MANVDYTLVVGVDAYHLWQLSCVWPTWRKHKPQLAEVPMVVFYDRQEVKESDVRKVLRREVNLVPWPPEGVKYEGDPKDKWTKPQRSKMLSGFVHVPAMAVATDYWLKLDTDVVATGEPNWIKGSWFDDSPAIVCHKWGFTRPPNQMLELDDWVKENRSSVGLMAHNPPLHLTPEEGSDRLSHPRIISWCGFFCTALTKYASQAARAVCGEGKLPVPSQDGYLWYVATRLNLAVHRVHMKKLGWEHWSSSGNVKKHAAEAMK